MVAPPGLRSFREFRRVWDTPLGVIPYFYRFFLLVPLHQLYTSGENEEEWMDSRCVLRTGMMDTCCRFRYLANRWHFVIRFVDFGCVCDEIGQ